MRNAAVAECPYGRCDGDGWERIQDGTTSRVQRCPCWTDRLKPAGVPAYFVDATLTNFRERPGNALAIKVARDWLDGKQAGDLYFCGEVGRGKTRLACSLLNDRFRRGARTAYFCRVPFLLLLQRQGIDDVEKKAEANRIFDRCLTADVLCFDDVAGGEKPSDFSWRTIVTLYDQRLDRGLATIWTSNCNLGELAAFYGDDRLSSRIAGACGEVIEIGGDDFRAIGTRY